MTQKGLMVDNHSPAEEFPALIEPEGLLLYLQKPIIGLHLIPLESNLFPHTQFP
jgi:hypothetical protein